MVVRIHATGCSYLRKEAESGTPEVIKDFEHTL
jgi:hypothetical protein